MKIFVTGGSGFIGRHLMPLIRHHEVLCLSHEMPIAVEGASFRTVVGDLKMPASYSDELKNFRPDCCIHLAWEGLPDYSFQSCYANLSASALLFNVLSQLACKKVFTVGSCWEYGAQAGALKEEIPGLNPSLFGVYKTALQTIGQSIFGVEGSRFIWGRVFFAYGPGQRSSSLIPSCYRSFKNDTMPKITNPMASHDFIHVADVAEAIHKLIEVHDAVGIYNVGSGERVAVWEAVNLVASEMGLPPVYKDMPESKEGLWANINKIGLLDWQPKFTLKSGIKNAIQELSKN